MEGINRYVDVNFDQPMSNYVPLPLDTLYKLGKDADKTYEDTLKDLDSGRDPLSKLKLRTSVKVYDPNVEGGVRDAAIDFEDQKANYLDYINKQKQMIVDDYIKDKDSAKFRQRASKLKGDVTSIYNDLASKSAIVDKIDKHNAEIEKQQDPSLKEFLRNKELEYNTGYYNQYQQGKLNDYSSYNTAKYTDRAKEVKEFFGSLGEEVQQMYASPTGDGYIRTKYLEGRTKDKIRNTFDSWFENSTVKADMDLELNDLFARTGMNPKAKRKVKVDGKEVEVTNYDYFRNQQMNQALDMAYGFSTSKGHEDLKSDATALRAMDKKDAEDYETSSVTGAPSTVSVEKALSDAGLAGVFDDQGNIKFEKGLSIQGDPYSSLPSISMKSGDPIKVGQEAGKKIAVIANKLGINADPKSVYNYFVNISKQASTTTELHPSTQKAITENLFGENTDISNMEFYPQGAENANDKATSEIVNVIANNSSSRGLDYYSKNGTGFKLTVTPKDGNKASGVDVAYIAIPKDITLQRETKPINDISVGAINYAKTGDIDPARNINGNDLDFELANKFNLPKGSGNRMKKAIENKIKTDFSKDSKMISSSYEIRKDGTMFIRGVTQLPDNRHMVVEYEVDADGNGKFNNIKSLNEVQQENTKYLETKGVLKKYNTSLQQKIKPSSVNNNG